MDKNRQILTPTPLTPVPQPQVQGAQPEVQTMTFPEAMKMILNGKQVKRLAWSPSPDYALLKDGWLTIFTKGKLHTWKVNDGDMEGVDWIVVREGTDKKV